MKKLVVFVEGFFVHPRRFKQRELDEMMGNLLKLPNFENLKIQNTYSNHCTKTILTQLKKTLKNKIYIDADVPSLVFRFPKKENSQPTEPKLQRIEIQEPLYSVEFSLENLPKSVKELLIISPFCQELRYNEIDGLKKVEAIKNGNSVSKDLKIKFKTIKKYYTPNSCFKCEKKLKKRMRNKQCNDCQKLRCSYCYFFCKVERIYDHCYSEIELCKSCYLKKPKCGHVSSQNFKKIMCNECKGIVCSECPFYICYACDSYLCASCLYVKQISYNRKLRKRSYCSSCFHTKNDIIVNEKRMYKIYSTVYDEQKICGNCNHKIGKIRCEGCRGQFCMNCSSKCDLCVRKFCNSCCSFNVKAESTDPTKYQRVCVFCKA